MGVKERIQRPSEVARCEDPAISATLPCASCWSKDYAKEIKVNPVKRYSDQLNAEGESYEYNFGTRQYKLIIYCKTLKKVSVEIRLKIEPDKGVDETIIEKSKKTLMKGIKENWDNKLSLKTTDPKCGVKIFPIEFKVVFVASNEHYVFRIHKQYNREGVTGKFLDVSKDTGAWVYAHEFGHCFGLPDEYGYKAGVQHKDQVVYYKPDGKLDAPFSVPYNGGNPAEPSSTIMAAYGNTTILKRHGWLIAIEARDLLNEPGLGRKIECDIV
ncbi:immune inhibitor A domain-containing protein [Kosakonia pseudosacchari]|uniref:immune inhibitor A domain-containing protein n=1 Tax=Kosakonia pseudosacchari TaxID=1646340 RepID=UPI000A37AE14|nr:immune inhibitor A domain-containing protein [Kosakonia pseudosacchari]